MSKRYAEGGGGRKMKYYFAIRSGRERDCLPVVAGRLRVHERVSCRCTMIEIVPHIGVGRRRLTSVPRNERSYERPFKRARSRSHETMRERIQLTDGCKRALRSRRLCRRHQRRLSPRADNTRREK